MNIFFAKLKAAITFLRRKDLFIVSKEFLSMPEPEVKEDSVVYKGMESISNVSAMLGEDGFWLVIHTVTQRRSEDGENWTEKAIAAKAIDRDLDNGVMTLQNALQNLLSKVGGDLFLLEESNDTQSPETS